MVFQIVGDLEGETLIGQAAGFPGQARSPTEWQGPHCSKGQSDSATALEAQASGPGEPGPMPGPAARASGH